MRQGCASEGKQVMKKTGLSRNTDQASQHNSQLAILHSEYDHKSFASRNVVPQKTLVNNSLGPKSSSDYFPNKTTSNCNHIVSIIHSQDYDPKEYKQNRILLEETRPFKAKVEVLDGIGEELNYLFTSSIERQEGRMVEMRGRELEFQNILG